jgi:hypothetical protein
MPSKTVSLAALAKLNPENLVMARLNRRAT